MSANPRPLGPLQISEIILRTTRFDHMRTWYRALFGGLEPSVEAATRRQLKSAPHVDRLCFLRIHVAFPYTQVLGLFEVAESGSVQLADRGLDHMQFRERHMDELIRRYKDLRGQGIRPTHAFDHGPSTSFYYTDPDENVVELSAVNFETESDYLAFFKSGAYRQNVEGHPIDPERFVAERRRSPDGHD